MDLFEDEQLVYDNAVAHAKAVSEGATHSFSEYETLLKEYRRLLKQLRRVTKISDRTTVDLHESNLDLEDKANYDGLTGIYNRRYMEETLKRVISSLSRSGGVLSVIMLDVDFFKKYNDTYGHSMGDDCLRSIAKAIQKSVNRPDDFVARYGGEEFIVVLPNTDKNGACAMASRVLKNIMACNIPHEKNEAANCVTASIGVTTGNIKHSQDSSDYIKRADEMLYKSKRNGRNQYNFVSFEEDT